MKSLIEGLDTTVQVAAHSSLNSIPSDVKLVILLTRVLVSGRPVHGERDQRPQDLARRAAAFFIGENGGYYSNGLALEDAFLASMGA